MVTQKSNIDLLCDGKPVFSSIYVYSTCQNVSNFKIFFSHRSVSCFWFYRGCLTFTLRIFLVAIWHFFFFILVWFLNNSKMFNFVCLKIILTEIEWFYLEVCFSWWYWNSTFVWMTFDIICCGLRLVIIICLIEDLLKQILEEFECLIKVIAELFDKNGFYSSQCQYQCQLGYVLENFHYKNV